MGASDGPSPFDQSLHAAMFGDGPDSPLLTQRLAVGFQTKKSKKISSAGE